MAGLFLWAVVSMFLLLGDENPEQPMSLSRFLIVKGLGVASFYALIQTCRMLYKAGYLPDVKEED